MNAFLIFFAKQKKLALLFTLSVVILGFMTLQIIQRDTYPVIEFDRLSIDTSYPSASPRDIEKNITNVIESKIKGIYGIKELTSTSSEGSSRINIEIEEDVDDIQSVKDSISEAVNEIEDLPEDAQEVVYEMCYQLGLGGFSKFKKTIQFLRLGDYEACSSEMLDSRWARQTPNRAKRLSDIIKNVR